MFNWELGSPGATRKFETFQCSFETAQSELPYRLGVRNSGEKVSNSIISKGMWERVIPCNSGKFLIHLFLCWQHLY